MSEMDSSTVKRKFEYSMYIKFDLHAACSSSPQSDLLASFEVEREPRGLIFSDSSLLMKSLMKNKIDALEMVICSTDLIILPPRYQLGWTGIKACARLGVLMFRT